MNASQPAATAAARDALAQVMGQQAWAVIRVRDSETVTVVGGPLVPTEMLADIPVVEGLPAPGRRFDTLVAVPFRQIAERGYDVHDDGAPLAVVQIESEAEVPLADLLAALPDETIGFTDRGGFETDDDTYAGTVERIIADEIGNGEGANLVIGRHYRAQLDGWDAAKALTVLRRLLENERGAYWTYCFWTGDRFLIGASPERHVSVHAGAVRMNPISGTFRLPKKHSPEASADLKGKLLDFLADEKEIYELFMVVDEELKMMCEICHEGGQVLGPFLKPMTHLVHTEYLLAGRTHLDVRDVLRMSMFAATVTGAPVENACKLIKAYEAEGRGYYAGALALIGRDENGAQTADSPILIRTADVSPTGALKVTAGATLVRDSDPHSEVAETAAKAGGILSAFGLVPAAVGEPSQIEDLAHDEDVLIALNSRNQRLSKFWLTDQGGAAPAPELAGRTVGILHGEDDFANMLHHVFAVLGMKPTIIRHEDFKPGGFDGFDLAVVGPGPGDPRDESNPKIATFRGAVDGLLAGSTPFLAVCLGHQVLCDRLGIPLAYKDIVFQGTQSEISIDGRSEVVGFYNTFVGRLSVGRLSVGKIGDGKIGDGKIGDGYQLPDGVRVETDGPTGDIHLVAGPHFRGVQFHAESILTENGVALLQRLLLDLVG